MITRCLVLGEVSCLGANYGSLEGKQEKITGYCPVQAQKEYMQYLVVLICISFMTNDVEPLFMSSFVRCLPYLKNCRF